MRKNFFLIGLLFFIPIFASAANPPSLTTYTLSDSIIYPAGSGGPIATTIDVAFSEKVKVSIKIVSSDGTAISFYASSGVTDPNAKSWDGTNTDGTSVVPGVYTILVSATAIATNLTMTDSSKTITVSSSGAAPGTASATTTPTVTTFSGSASTYTPPPSILSIQIHGEQVAMLEVPLYVSAQVTTKGSTVDLGAQITWSFGDGSRGEGSATEKTYHYAGTYLVIATATDGSAKARDEFTVTVKPAQVRLLPVSGDGITIMNDSSDRLDLSNWRLLSDTGSFRIPEGTTILPAAGVLFPFTITNLPMTFDATLLYPNGIVAARTTPALTPLATSTPSAEQPSPVVMSYKQVQTVESIKSTKTKVQSHAQAVLAPTASTELAAVGAALPEATSSAPKVRATGLFRSGWTLGLLGVIGLAGGAFVLL